MKPRIRKLNKNDIKALENIDNYNAKIIISELQISNNENGSSFMAYGVFESMNNIIGFCSIDKSDEFAAFEFWDNNSKAISDLFMQEKNLTNSEDSIEYICDLLYYVLNDEDNLNYNIFFNNSMNLNDAILDQLNLIPLEDGVVVRLSEKKLERGD